MSDCWRGRRGEAEPTRELYTDTRPSTEREPTDVFAHVPAPGSSPRPPSDGSRVSSTVEWPLTANISVLSKGQSSDRFLELQSVLYWINKLDFQWWSYTGSCGFLKGCRHPVTLDKAECL